MHYLHHIRLANPVSHNKCKRCLGCKLVLITCRLLNLYDGSVWTKLLHPLFLVKGCSCKEIPGFATFLLKVAISLPVCSQRELLSAGGRT